jgi:peptide-methionine (S)-S-oxide reductase
VSKKLVLSLCLLVLGLKNLNILAAPTPMTQSPTLEKATFGAGCFWGVEYNFRRVPGVVEAFSGYSGGKSANPTYRQVCNGDTYHAEVVEVTFDPKKVSYVKLVEFFFKMHDPTQLNRQGPDYGTQYRSVIFVHSEDQRKVAQEVIKKLTTDKKYAQPIVTQVEEAKPFWKAEEYHQKYFEKNGGPTCHITDI